MPDTTDIVERLRDQANRGLRDPSGTQSMLRLAANEIERLRGECSARVADARIKAENAALVPAGYVLVPVEREASVREVAKVALCVLCSIQYGQSWSAAAAKDIEIAIEGLRAVVTPQPMPQAERHLTPAESAAMDRALRRSVTVVAKVDTESKDG